jgi:MFS family permease
MTVEPVQGERMPSLTLHANSSRASLTAPLRIPVFRRFWIASMLANLGLLIQGVGAAWAMTQLTADVSMVALVQTALMAPVMLVAIPAGALADMFDKRKAGLAAVALSFAGASMLALTTLAGLLSPWTLLLFCFIVGVGNALFGPAWQSSSAEQVPASDLPQAIALNSISYNMARSFGPAVGGILVAEFGAIAAFGTNALLYVPLLLVLFTWRREALSARLPPERLGPAISSGVRYILNAPSIRVVLVRCFVNGVAGSSVVALMPLVARDLLGGSARVYGFVLGAFGIGAVIGALILPWIRARLEGQRIVTLSALTMAVAIGVVALSSTVALTALALVVGGAMWMVMAAVFNIGVQLSTPRWVAGRAVAAYQASISGGIAIGSWIWGHIAQGEGVSVALLGSAVVMTSTVVLGRWVRIPTPTGGTHAMIEVGRVDSALALTERSGPIVIEVEYRIHPDDARAFYRTMQALDTARRRIGAYGWSIARDISDPWLWIERYHLPTWLDYLRHRARHTAAERDVQDAAKRFHQGPEPVRVRRALERPLGSVRWRDDAPDPGLSAVTIGGS